MGAPKRIKPLMRRVAVNRFTRTLARMWRAMLRTTPKPAKVHRKLRVARHAG